MWSFARSSSMVSPITSSMLSKTCIKEKRWKINQKRREEEMNESEGNKIIWSIRILADIHHSVQPPKNYFATFFHILCNSIVHGTSLYQPHRKTLWGINTKMWYPPQVNHGFFTPLGNWTINFCKHNLIHQSSQHFFHHNSEKPNTLYLRVLHPRGPNKFTYTHNIIGSKIS